MSSSAPEARSPGFPPIPFGNLSSKGIDTTNTQYKTSDLRTSSLDLPFPHPKWHIRPRSGKPYEVTSPIFEEYDPRTGFVDSVGPIRESVENAIQPGEHSEDDEDEGEEHESEKAAPQLHVWRNAELEHQDRENKAENDIDVWKTEIEGYATYIQWPESSERSSIRREAKRGRDGAGFVEEETVVGGVRMAKRIRHEQ